MKVQLHDEGMAPFANLRYRLIAGGIRREGTTDASGWLDERVPHDASSAQVTLWLQDYPTGPRRNWLLELIDRSPPPVTVDAAVPYLMNLGYYTGEKTAELTPEVAAALRAFQEDNQLPVTGSLDAQTIITLIGVHDD